MKDSIKIKELISKGEAVLGIELGSTRIKAVLLDDEHNSIATGGFDWSNSYVDGIWTYNLDEVWKGLQESYSDLCLDVKKKYDCEIRELKALGISAMMHGYLPFDKNGEQISMFRTWRNNCTFEASTKLMKVFNYPIPQRWSISHLYQLILNGDSHVEKLDYFTTLSGYVHWKLTGEKVLGVDDASGMFPIDIETGSFNREMINKFNDLVKDKNYSWKLENVLPKVLLAGENAGKLSEEGARLLDKTGKLKAGVPLCPPEGDAGTGMVATNSVSEKTGNVSAGTSIFAMVVLEKELKKVHPEIDLVTTPSGKLVAMSHSNNCTSNMDDWIKIFDETLKAFGVNVDKAQLYSVLYNKAMEGDKDCGGLLSYGYLSGEHMTGFEEGRPVFARTPESNFNLANFMRTNIQTSLGAVKIGMDILRKEENVKIEKMLGHGGLFKTKNVGQSLMAAAVDAPVAVMETAGEGGAWGIAVLASYLVNRDENESLEAFLEHKVFTDSDAHVIAPDKDDVEGFEKFMERYKACLPVERAAVDCLK